MSSAFLNLHFCIMNPMNRETSMKLAKELRPSIQGQAMKNPWKPPY